MKLYSALFLGMVFVRGLAVEHQGDKRSLPTQRNAPREVVEQFINIVRSGRDPAKASEFFAPLVQAHQLTSEGETTIVRTPEDYAAHVQEFLRTYGTYKLTIAELVSDGDRVYVRWKQEGRHLAPIHGFQPTGLPLVEVTSAVYRVKNGKIVEYWIQTDRKGVELQLQTNATKVRDDSRMKP